MNIIKKIFTKSRSLEDGIFFDSNNFGFPKKLALQKAFTHRSTSKQCRRHPINYERLEFLGDAMLSSVIAAHLFNKAPQETKVISLKCVQNCVENT
jgi:ribonuclease-3